MQQKINFSSIKITGGFWKEKQDMVKNSTVWAVYERFKDTHRFDALKCTWKMGNPNMPHIFWDSDVAKWIEGVAYILKEERNEKLEKIVDEAIDDIVKNSDENGYFNSHYLVTEQNQRFKHRDNHELYCAGHLIEAAVAYFDATGKDKFLKAMCRFADYIERIFITEKSADFITPGHPEIELALIRLYLATGENRYFQMAEFFIDEHGKHYQDKGLYENIFTIQYNMDDMPLKDRETAEGHCVRALYLLCGMADVAKLRGDEELLSACRRLFENITAKRMYITGGVGSSHLGEAFTIDYDLPNRTAYNETCAAISLAMFCCRMQAIEADSKYADTVERVIYNGFLSGVSQDGKAFFYENPLEIDPAFNDVNTSSVHKSYFPITQRKEVFDCSCCPPNILRFIPAIADYMYTYDDKTVFIHQYINSMMNFNGIAITQTTDYPQSGKIIINAKGQEIALRIPGWCKSFKLNVEYELKNGYAYTKSEDEIILELDMPLVAMRSNRRVHENVGRVAFMRGPVVYCAEGVDNVCDLKSVRVDIHPEYSLKKGNFILPDIKMNAYQEKIIDNLYSEADDEYEKINLTLIPYYAFANRGTSEMLVWLLKK